MDRQDKSLEDLQTLEARLKAEAKAEVVESASSKAKAVPDRDAPSIAVPPAIVTTPPAVSESPKSAPPVQGSTTPFRGEFNLPDAAAPPPGSEEPPPKPPPNRFRWGRDPTTGRDMVRTEQDWEQVERGAQEQFAAIAKGKPQQRQNVPFDIADQNAGQSSSVDAWSRGRGGQGESSDIARQTLDALKAMVTTLDEINGNIKYLRENWTTASRWS